MSVLRNSSLAILAGIAMITAVGCESSGIGDPCLPEREYDDQFAAFAITEVETESRSFQCETRLCLVNHFQGRVSCTYGNLNPDGTVSTEANRQCYPPDNTAQNLPLTIGVEAQRYARPPSSAVYCSCRCDGPDADARYCECPSGYICEALVPPTDGAPDQLVGSYCIKSGTQTNGDSVSLTLCSNAATPNCEAADDAERYEASLRTF